MKESEEPAEGGAEAIARKLIEEMISSAEEAAEMREERKDCSRCMMIINKRMEDTFSQILSTSTL